jgi:hypothetical protein
MPIEAHLTQAKALLADASGYLDKVRLEAEDIAARAGKLDDAAKEYDALCAAIAAKKEELSSLKADIAQAERAFQAFQKIASTR